MNKFHKLQKALGLVIIKPWLLNNILNENQVWKKYVDKHYQMGNGFPAVDIVELLGEINETIDPYSFLDGGSLLTDLVILKGLARKIKDCSYFEVGTWRGESVANVAQVAQECYTLDLSQMEIRNAGYSDEYIKQYGVLSRKYENIVHLRGNSKDYDFAGLNKKFDLIFIDGDHHYELIKNDCRKVFTHLVHEDTIVVWHDYAKNPELIRYEVMAGILDGTPKQYHKNIYFVSNSLCAIYTNKELKTHIQETPVKLNKVFNLKIKSGKIKE